MSVESLILKATDAALTADNWQYILDVTDKISLAPEEHTKPAIKVVATRLALNDANVILRTLSLLVAMAENCGSRMKQEIATKLFLQDSLIKRLANKKLHKTVKAAIVQVIEQLYETFKKDPSLKPMTDAYNQAMAEYPQYSSKRQRQHSAPDKPGKKEISETDKQKEEEELQRVLKLSLSEFEKQQSVKTYLNTKPLPTPEQDDASLQRAKLAQQKTGEQTIATVSKVRALYDLVSYEPEELSFRKGDVITVIESVYRDWWRGSLPGGRIGIFPLNYVTPIVSQSLEEIASEVAAEDKLIHSELRKVDKLLGLLSSGASINDLNEDEITQLYNEVIPLRTSLGKFIDKYSVRKEELLELNTHFNTEVKDYNDLMEKLISQRSQGRYNHQNHSGLPYPSQQQQYQPPNTAFEYSQQRAQHTQPSQPQYNPPVSQPQHTYQTPPQHTQPVQPLQNAQQTQPPQHTQASRTQQEWNQQRYASYPSYPEASYEQLQLQPTSSGFGNAFSPDRYGSQQHTGQQQVQSVGHDPRFLNINDFPSLNNV